jgi:trehalose 6-phosphate phosphatase
MFPPLGYLQMNQMSRRKDRERHFRLKQQDPNYAGFRGSRAETAPAPVPLESVTRSVCQRKRNVPVDTIPETPAALSACGARSSKPLLYKHNQRQACRTESMPSSSAIKDLPYALESEREISWRLHQGKPAVFLDYDGTLTPIVDDPAQALLPLETRQVVQRLAGLCTAAIISGRDLDDVREMVRIEGIAYAGSHGFDIIGPDGQHRQQERWQDFLEPLDTAQEELRRWVKGIPGARVERKRFAVAVHYRAVDAALVDELEERVNTVVSRHPQLRKTGGKKIFELRPDVDWDKGKALLFLLEALGLPAGRTVPVFIGDDVTDEDGFRAISNSGITIVVGQEDRHTQAHYTLRDPEETRAFLEMLVKLLEGVRQ